MQTTDETAADPGAVLTIASLAARWDLDPSTVWRRWKHKQLPEEIFPGLRAWRLATILEWERKRESAYMQLIDAANDVLWRLADIVERAESDGRVFSLNERRQIVSLQAQLDQFGACMRRIRERDNQKRGVQDNDIE